MNRAKSLSLVRLALAAAILLALQGCTSNQAQNVEKPIAAGYSKTCPAASPAPSAKLPPPTQAQVQEAFHRVFGDDLVAQSDESTGRAAFIVGDFNGDQSEDLAMIVHPAAGKLDEVNNELANWTIQDADKAFIAPPGKAVVTPPKQTRPRVERGEQLLAIIHGVWPRGLAKS